MIQNAHPPRVLEVDAKKQDHMLYVCLRQPAILSALGLKARVRHLEQKVQIYDAVGEKWFHSPAETLWLRLNIKEGLILKASHIRVTLGLEKYVPKSLTKPFVRGSDTLPSFLASARAATNSGIPAFGPVPPLTVMVATIPEDDIVQTTGSASSSSCRLAGGDSVTGSESASPSNTCDELTSTTRVTKRQKLNNGAATSTSGEVIDISSDEEFISTPPAQSTQGGDSNQPPPSQRPRKRTVVHPPKPQVVLPRLRGQANPQYTYWKLIPRATQPTVNPEVIVVSDDESSSTGPVAPIAPASTSSGPSAPTKRVRTTEPAAGRPSAAAGPSTVRGDRVVHPHGHVLDGKGKGKMRAQKEDNDNSDSGVDSDATLV